MKVQIENKTQNYLSMLRTIESDIAKVRNAIHQDALNLAEEFHEKRMAISEGFSNLNVVVRRRYEGRGIQIAWAQYHFKNGLRSGVTSLKKRRGEHYDLATIRLAAPKWLHQLAADTELCLRPLREALECLTRMDRDLRVLDSRLCTGAALKPNVALEGTNEIEGAEIDFNLVMDLWEGTAPLEPEEV